MPKRVALYVRVSTQEQAQEGYSIDAQTERLTSYCKAKGWPIARTYTDPGFSGANIQRPALQCLFEDIEAGHIDCVLVYKLDRLSRSQKDTLYIIEDVLLAHGVDFVSMQENFDTSSPFGRAMIGILSVFAQLEREQIKERMAMGMAERAKSGLWHGGGNYMPTGYRYANGKLMVDNLGAEVVRDIYSMFLDHVSLKRIGEVLQERYGQKWYPFNIKYVLSNPLYLGKVHWKGNVYQGQHEAIISEDDFRKARDLLDDMYRIAMNKPLPFRPRYLLSGILVCGNCGAKYFTRSWGNGKKFYTCFSRTKAHPDKVIDPKCKNPNYRVDELDAKIIAEVIRLSSDEAYFKSSVSQNEKKGFSRMDRKRSSITQRISALDSQISRILDLYQLGTIGIDEIGQRAQKLQDEKAALQDTLKRMESLRPNSLSVSEARSLLEKFRFTINSDDMDAKRNILHALVKKIIAKPNRGEIEIVWNF